MKDRQNVTGCVAPDYRLGIPLEVKLLNRKVGAYCLVQELERLAPMVISLHLAVTHLH